MKIDLMEENKRKIFQDIFVRGTFLFEGSLYMKIYADTLFNVINLRTGGVEWFCDDESVLPIKCKIVKDVE